MKKLNMFVFTFSIFVFGAVPVVMAGEMHGGYSPLPTWLQDLLSYVILLKGFLPWI
jgi:hypothetical protein